MSEFKRPRPPSRKALATTELPTAVENSMPSEQFANLGSNEIPMPSLGLISHKLDIDDGYREVQTALIDVSGMKATTDPYSKLPGPQPAALNASNIETFVPTHWATAKLDGVRMMLLIEADMSFLIDRKFVVRQLAVNPASVATQGRIVLDGELCWGYQEETNKASETKMDLSELSDSRSAAPQFKFMVFDCLMFDDEPVVDKKTSERLKCVATVCERWKQARSRYPNSLPLIAKQMVQIGKFPDLLATIDQSSEEWKQTVDGMTFFADGLVFMAENATYKFLEHNSLLKWKEVHTIDVLTDPQSWSNSLSTPSLSLSAATSGTKWNKINLYHFGLDNKSLVPLKSKLGSGYGFVTNKVASQVLQAYKTLAREKKRDDVAVVVECAFDIPSGQWVVIRPRSDKDRPNYITVIEETRELIHQNLKIGKIESILADKSAFERKQAAPRNYHPSIRAVAKKLGPLMAEWAREGQWELEMQIIPLDQKTKTAFYEQVLERQKKPPAGYPLQFKSAVPTVDDTEDLFYPYNSINDKGEDGRPVRYRVTQKFDKETREPVVVERMLKTTFRTASIDVKTPDKFPKFFLQITAKREKAVSESELKKLAAEAPVQIRKKSRTSFTLDRDDFRLDFTRVKTAATKRDVATSEWTTEIENEMLRGDYNAAKNPASLAYSFLTKSLVAIGAPLSDAECSTFGVYDAQDHLVYPGTVDLGSSSSDGSSIGAAAAASLQGSARGFSSTERTLGVKPNLLGFGN